ncbi:hypothetical protein IEQ34_007596 [Dendrobium chrysotoxum]|uniref:Uncharacterized protein n=1 Tax=Dendrobium chrysotoxum TaxID=161865 RepID=A0AAV7H4M4_DENCH|nr:hypothetical protein IEQ34_007596 [Dendrobium chrysotoxum]
MNSEKMEREDRKEEEEEKMKKFYMLIENIRATRMLWETEPSKRQKRESLLWKPTFEWEDFSQAASSNIGDAGISRGKEKEEGTDSGVDLSLGL